MVQNTKNGFVFIDIPLLHWFWKPALRLKCAEAHA